MNPAAPQAFQGSYPATYIEYCVDTMCDDGGQGERSILQAALSTLAASAAGGNSYSTNQPPYLVLSRLESPAGYKVVASNSVTDPPNVYNLSAARLGDAKCFSCRTDKPACVVLDLLENQGYKVVGTSASGDTYTWTLHKEA
ncbi:hypothetical protein ACROYT_G040207 [Oculina patagonica]